MEGTKSRQQAGHLGKLMILKYLRTSSRGSVAALAVATVFTGSSAPSLAGSFGLREYSTVGIGMSNAGLAVGSGGVAGIFFNPATVTMFPGVQTQTSLSGILPSSNIRPLAPTPTLGFGPSGELGNGKLVPASGFSAQLGDHLYFGLASGSPWGLVTSPRYNSANQVYSRTSRVFSVNFTPTIGWRFNDYFSVGAGMQVEYFRTTLKRATGVLPNAPSAILNGSGTDLGATVGATFTPWAGTVLGVGWRSQIDHTLEGIFNVAALTLPINTTIKLPSVLTLSASQEITNRFRVLGSFEYTDWSRFNSFPVISEVTNGPLNIGAGPTVLNFRYKDGYYFSVGGEFKVTPEWTARAGVGYDISPIDTSNRTTNLPDANRVYASIGASYDWNERLSFDAAYSHLFVDRARINIVPGNPAYAGLPYFGTADSSVDILSVGLRYKLGDVFYTPERQSAALVRKY